MPIAFPAKPVSLGPCRWTRPACIRSRAPGTLLLTDRLLPTPLWFHEAWKTQTILLSLKLRSASRSGLRIHRIRDVRRLERKIEVAMSGFDAELYCPISRGNSRSWVLEC